MKRILVVDDEKNIRKTVSMILNAEGWDAAEAASGEEAVQVATGDSFPVVLLDVRLPGMDGLQTLEKLREQNPDVAVIMMSGHASVAVAVEATRKGAYDFLEKPLTKEKVLVAVRNAARFRVLDREVGELRRRESGRRTMIGDSSAMRKIRETIEQVAPTTARVLILGESGTGKELVARAIHEASECASGPFVKVNCAAIPEELIEGELFGAEKGAYTGAVSARDGKFMQADGGTLFLDEVGDMSLRAQAKVLRALQEGEVERVGGTRTIPVTVRVLAATNKDLEAEVKAGTFREDLFFRLNVVPLHVAPLRERRDDIPALIGHLAETYRLENNRAPVTFEESAVTKLVGHAWPGNIRELANVVERLVILTRGDRIGLDALANAGLGGATGEPGAGGSARGARPFDPMELVRTEGGLANARRAFETDCIRHALRDAGGNVSEAARGLQIDRTNLHKKIQSYGIEPAEEGKA